MVCLLGLEHVIKIVRVFPAGLENGQSPKSSTGCDTAPGFLFDGVSDNEKDTIALYPDAQFDAEPNGRTHLHQVYTTHDSKYSGR